MASFARSGARLFGWTVRWRYLVFAVWVGGLCAVTGTRSDWLYFEMAGRVLLNKHGHYPIPGGPLHMYDDMPLLQLGPPAAVVAALTQLLDPLPGRVVAIVLMAALGLVCVRALEVAAASLGVDPSQRRRTSLLGGLVFLGCWADLAGRAMHLDDVLAVSSCAVAVAALSRNRGLLVGVMLGLAAASKPWAVAAVPLLFALPRRQIPKAALAAVAVAVACWAPFLLAAPSTMLSLATFHIPVEPDSTLALFVRPLTATPGLIRPLQFGVGALLTGFAVWRGRWWLALLLAFELRVAIDPAAWMYYSVPVLFGALVADYFAVGRKLPWLTALAAATLMGVPRVAHGHVGAVLRLVALVVIGILAWRMQPRSSQLQAAVDNPYLAGDVRRAHQRDDHLSDIIRLG